MTDCPPWYSDKDEHFRPECFTSIGRVVVDACAAALKAVPQRRDISMWHRESFCRLVPLDYYAGGFRQDDPKRLCLGQDVAVDGQHALPFVLVLSEMSKLCEFMNRNLVELELKWQHTSVQDRLRRVAQIVGTSIGRFIQIHPFLNGNGRMSRILWTVLLARLGLRPQISIVRRPGPPYGEVMQAAMRGNYGPAVAVVLSGLSRAPMPPRALPTATTI
jgi:Fic/DOC family protein